MLKYPQLHHQYLSLSSVNVLYKFVRSMLHILKASQENIDSLSWVFPIVSMVFKCSISPLDTKLFCSEGSHDLLHVMHNQNSDILLT